MYDIMVDGLLAISSMSGKKKNKYTQQTKRLVSPFEDNFGLSILKIIV